MGFAQSPFARRVHPSIMWAKLKSLVEGARIATRVLWGNRRPREVRLPFNDASMATTDKNSAAMMLGPVWSFHQCPLSRTGVHLQD
jgi:hypothetical protein